MAINSTALSPAPARRDRYSLQRVLCVTTNVRPEGVVSRRHAAEDP